jgi:hypothetical protein
MGPKFCKVSYYKLRTIKKDDLMGKEINSLDLFDNINYKSIGKVDPLEEEDSNIFLESDLAGIDISRNFETEDISYYEYIQSLVFCSYASGNTRKFYSLFYRYYNSIKINDVYIYYFPPFSKIKCGIPFIMLTSDVSLYDILGKNVMLHLIDEKLRTLILPENKLLPEGVKFISLKLPKSDKMENFEFSFSNTLLLDIITLDLSFDLKENFEQQLIELKSTLIHYKNILQNLKNVHVEFITQRYNLELFQNNLIGVKCKFRELNLKLEFRISLEAFLLNETFPKNREVIHHPKEAAYLPFSIITRNMLPLSLCLAFIRNHSKFKKLKNNVMLYVIRFLNYFNYIEADKEYMFTHKTARRQKPREKE